MLPLPRKVTVELHQILRLPRKVTLELHFSTLLYSSLLYYPLLYSTLLYCSLLYSTLLYSSLLFATLLYYTLLFSTICYSTLLFSTIRYSPLLYSTLLYSSLLFSAILLLYYIVLTLRSRLYIGSSSCKPPLIISYNPLCPKKNLRTFVDVLWLLNSLSLQATIFSYQIEDLHQSQGATRLRTGTEDSE